MEGVRRADAADVPRVVELLDKALHELGRHRGAALLTGAGPEAVTAPGLVERWLTEPTHRLLLGTFEQAVVGVGAAGLGEPVSPRRGQLECLYVEPVARGVGVGRTLLEELVAWMGAQGCAGVDAVALPGDRSSKQALEAAGFKARLLVLHRPLG